MASSGEVPECEKAKEKTCCLCEKECIEGTASEEICKKECEAKKMKFGSWAKEKKCKK
jgi:hypothetical protein